MKLFELEKIRKKINLTNEIKKIYNNMKILNNYYQSFFIKNWQYININQHLNNS